MRKQIVRGTAACRAHLALVKQLPCAACVSMGRPASGPSHAHHIHEMGMSLKASDFEVLPLCDEHHDQGIPGVSVHAGRKIWRFDERELLAWVWGRLVEAGEIPQGTPVGCPYEPRRRSIF